MITARQMSSEYGNSTMIEDYAGTWLETISVMNFNGEWEHESEELKKLNVILDGYDWICRTDMDSDESEEAIMDLFGDLNCANEYPPVELMKHTVNAYFGNSLNDKLESIRYMLGYMTGKCYAAKKINSDIKNEYTWVLYPTDEWTDDAINDFGIEYFNMGNEWEVSNGKNFWYIYTHTYDVDDQKREIANVVGCDASEITLYE